MFLVMFVEYKYMFSYTFALAVRDRVDTAFFIVKLGKIKFSFSSYLDQLIFFCSRISCAGVSSKSSKLDEEIKCTCCVRV